MFDARQIRRTIVLTGALAAFAAPVASARPADESSYAKPSVGSARSDAVQTQPAPGLGELAARREARSAEQWRAANRVSVAAIPEPEGAGLSWPSAAIGAAVPVALVLFGLTGYAIVVHRRRHAAGGIGRGAPTGA